MSESVAAEAFRSHAPVTDLDSIGLGWFVSERHGETLIFHTAGTAGGAAYMALLPGRDLGLIVLSNSMTSPAAAIGRGILDIVLGQTPAPIGPDGGRLTSYILSGISAVLAVLLLLLVARLVQRATRGTGMRRRWLLALRAVLVTGAAGFLWAVLPGLLTATGLPLPFGVRGYPFDVGLAALLLLTVPSSWALYSLATLAVGWRKVAAVSTRPSASGTD